MTAERVLKCCGKRGWVVPRANRFDYIFYKFGGVYPGEQPVRETCGHVAIGHVFRFSAIEDPHLIGESCCHGNGACMR